MIKLFSNRKIRRSLTIFLLGIQIGCLGNPKLSYATDNIPAPPPIPVPENAQESANLTTESSGESTQSSSISSVDVQSAAQSGAQQALDNSMDDLSSNIATELSGGSGVTWGDIYSSLNDVDSSVKALSDYVSDKAITENDYYCTIVGMYLSQYVATMQGNLLNIVTGLEENLDDSKLDTKLMIGNKKDAITLREALDYIKSSYRVTPIYTGSEDSKIGSVATLADMYEKSSSSLYIKDTYLDIKEYEVTNTKSGAQLSKVTSGIEGYIPALSYEARNSDSFKINKLTLENRDVAYCVFNASSACRLALQFAYSELERYNEYEKGDSMWFKQEALLDQGLHLDNFGNIVALDPSNKQYTIVLNCMLNPTICAIGSNEQFNMTAYGVSQVYSNHNQSGSDALGLNYDKGNNAYEYRVSLNKDTTKVLQELGTSDYIATKWVSNLLGQIPCDNPKANSDGYFAVFTFTNNDKADAEVTGPYDDKVNKPGNISVTKIYGSTKLNRKGHVAGGELNPSGGFEASVTDGFEGGELNKVLKPDESASIAYIKTNHNRATEAFYGYKGWFEKRAEDVYKGAFYTRSSKATNSNRGNLGGYTVMPVKTRTLFYGVGNEFIKSDTNSFDAVDASGNTYSLDYDLYGYFKDYCSFFSGSRDNSLTKYVGFLYTPKTTQRGKRSYKLESGSSNPSLKDIDAETIFLHLQICCKTGILRKANITNLGRGSSNGKEPKGLKGYHESTSKLIEEANGKVTDYINNGFNLDNDSPIQGVKYKKIWALGLNIYGGESSLLEQSKRTVVVYKNMLGDKYSMSDYDTVGFLLAVSKNTSSSTVKVNETGELSEEAKQSLKEEKATNILDRVLHLLTNPITTFMKLVSGFLQWVHTGLSNGRLVSFFYISNEDVNNWLGTLPAIVMYICLMVFSIRMAIGAIKFVFTKEHKFKDLAKDFVISSSLIAIPFIFLSFMRFGVATISDKGMHNSTTKIESVYLNKELLGSSEFEIASETAESESAKYFIENFTSKRLAKVAIQVLSVSAEYRNKTINPNDGKTSNYVYELFDVGSVPSIMVEIAERNANLDENSDKEVKYGLCYDGMKFNTVFHDYYDQSLFFYFLDYYLNEWCLLNSKVSYYNYADSSWATTMQSELITSKDSFRDLYGKRAVIYGPSAGLSVLGGELDDIFGLGQLFYHDGETVDSRGYYLPIEIYDSKMKTTDKTYKNSSVDLWNSYKHSGFFTDDRFASKQTINQADTQDVERLGKSEYNMAYGFETLKARKEKYPDIAFKKQVIASEAVFVANDIPTKYATDLEQALWEVNENIYKDTIDYFNNSSSDINDFTDVVMLACISTFRFNEKFGKSFNFNNAFSFDTGSNYLFRFTSTVQPTSFRKEELDMDVIMKAVYAGDNSVKGDYDLMYYLGSDTFGAIAAIILIVAEIFLIAYLIVRMIHLIVLYVLVALVCVTQYSLRKKTRNKAWLGALSQALYFFLAHVIQIFMMNMAVCNDLDRGGLTSVLLSLLLFLGSAFSITVEIYVMVFLIKNFRDLGGQIVADSVSSAMAKIKGKIEGKLKGDMKSDKIEQHADEVNSYGNSDDEELREASGGNTELVESVEQANRIRGKSTIAESSALGLSTGTVDDYINMAIKDVGENNSVSGGETFGDTSFEQSRSSDTVTGETSASDDSIDI